MDSLADCFDAHLFKTHQSTINTLQDSLSQDALAQLERGLSWPDNDTLVLTDEIAEREFDDAIAQQLSIELELKLVIERNCGWMRDFMREAGVNTPSVLESGFLTLC